MTDREFDQKVKSLLANAGEAAPDGAWDAIRARIPAKAAKTAAPWWWAGAGLAAAAAAVAMALVLGGTFRTDPSVVTAGEGPVVAQVAEPQTQVAKKNVETAVEEKAVEQAVPSQAVPKSTGPAFRVSKRAVPTGLKPKTLPDGSQSATTAPSSSATPAESAPAAKGVESATTKTAPAAKGSEKTPATKTSEKTPTQVSEKTVQGWSDPFARMAYEDAHRKTRRGVSLDINGLVGTNDKAMATLRNGMMAVPAKAQSATGQSTYITEEGESRYGVPLSFGLGAKFYLSDRWALGTGVSYSLLSRSFPGSYTKEGAVIKPANSNIKHTIQYIGIPVNLYYDLVSNRFMTMYTFAGGSVEKGIVQKYTIPGSGGTEVWKQKVPGLQGSAALGLGVQMKLSDHLGLYVDPSARYYFGANQPKSIRTQQKVMFNLELGVRFDL
jgi:hypothetical protein